MWRADLLGLVAIIEASDFFSRGSSSLADIFGISLLGNLMQSVIKGLRKHVASSNCNPTVFPTTRKEFRHPEQHLLAGRRHCESNLRRGMVKI